MVNMPAAHVEDVGKCVSGQNVNSDLYLTESIPFKEFSEKYKIVGRGCYSTVVILNEKDDYVFKRIYKPLINSKDRKSLLNEINILKLLKSSYVICMIDYFQSTTSYNLKLERGDKNLFEFSQKAKLSSKIIINIVKDLCKSIHYIHSINIYHRDIKPENVMVFFENQLQYQFKLCDFGLSYIGNDIGKGECGSKGFYAPEVSNQNNFSRKYADYWSLGCIILEQILGTKLFDSKWIIGCYEDIDKLLLANSCENFLKPYYTTNSELEWLLVRSLLNPNPLDRILPYPNTVNSSSCEVLQTNLIKQFLKSNSKKYNKIHPIED
tara:strand:+ start:1681 stop:2649 length:969 start_codon:yes stop_codon:yes gene_type:complete